MPGHVTVAGYLFGGPGGHGYPIAVSANREAHVNLLEGLDLDIDSFNYRGTVRPGQSLVIRPMLRSSTGLYLADCTESTAEIRLRAPTGAIVQTAQSGFQ